MCRFVFIALLAIIATTSAKPHVLSYPTGYYGSYISPSYYDYPYYSYSYTPVTYVETVPVTTVVGAAPPPVATVPFVPAKYVSRNAAQAEGPPPPSTEQELQPEPAPPAPAPPAPSAPGGPVRVIIVKKSFPDIDPAKLLSALPVAQLLELPPVKKLIALKTSKLDTIMGLKSALQAKLAPIAALLP